MPAPVTPLPRLTGETSTIGDVGGGNGVASRGLEHAIVALQRDFEGAIPAAVIRRRMEQVFALMLRDAKVDKYVPLLTYRQVRREMRDATAEPPGDASMLPARKAS